MIPPVRLPIVKKLPDLLGLSSSLAVGQLNLKDHVEIVKKFRGSPVLHPRNILRETTSAVTSVLLYVKFSGSNSAASSYRSGIIFFFFLYDATFTHCVFFSFPLLVTTNTRRLHSEAFRM